MVRRGSDDNIIYSRGGYIAILASSLPDMQVMLKERRLYNTRRSWLLGSSSYRMCLDYAEMAAKFPLW